MKDKTKILCVLGGFYFVFGYILDQLRDSFQEIQIYKFFELAASCFDYLSTVLSILFVILFFTCLFKKQGLIFINNFMNKFPKISVYLYYIGYVGYILLLVDLLLLTPTEFVSLSEMTQKYIEWTISIINIAGIFIALILASHDVFFKCKENIYK